MKKLFLILSVAAVVGACKKDSENAPASKTDMLTAKTWQITTVAATVGGIALPGSQFVSACQLDNTFKFNTDKTMVMDEGATKCNTTDPQTQNGTWAFANTDQTKLTITVPNSVFSGDFDIKDMSASTLRLSGNPQLAVGLPVVFDVTFSPK